MHGFKKVFVSATLCFSAGQFLSMPVMAQSVDYIAGSTEVSGDIIARPGEAVDLLGYATHPELAIARYEWDFDNDGIVDYSSTSTGITQHTYTEAGGYVATFRAWLEDGTLLPISSVKVGVSEDVPAAAMSPSAHQQKSEQPMASSAMSGPAADGSEKHYVLIINGGSETRFWLDMEFLYETLKQKGYADEDIYLLNHNGTNPSDENPNSMIDYAATKENLQSVINELAGKVDGDDILHVFVDDHGNGYTGPVQYTSSQQTAYGYNGGVISVDPGDEVDYIESEFKLRAIVNYGEYYARHQMNKWGMYKHNTNNSFYRIKYVSTISNQYFEAKSTTVNDIDESIERLKDYLRGDTNRNGRLDSGEVEDFDGDGIPPYDHSTGTFDEDDWGGIDDYDDNYDSFTAPAGIPPVACSWRKVMDIGLDNTIDYLCSSDGQNYVVIATDFDNDGLYDGVDVNMDGDFDDNVSIDETISLYGSTITDDELAVMLDQINPAYMTIVMEQCNSGGFIDDLSRSNRVIYTAAEDETVSWGNLFIRNTISAFKGERVSGAASVDPLQADINGNGEIDFAEAFRFSTDNDSYPEVPQYDDNGDGIYSAAIPNGSEGALGAQITLAQNIICDEFTASNTSHESAGRAYSSTETTGETCYGTFCFGGTTTTTWFAQGSDDELGTSGSTQTTLHSISGGYALGACPVPDTTAPVISLNGSANMTVIQGDSFTDPGATAQDDIDGDISANIVVEGNVNTNVLGLYILTYSVTDSANNTAEIQRQVRVEEAPDCVEYTDTVVNHESQSRAYSQSETTGQTCYGTFCFGGTTTTIWYVQGSNENLGDDGSATVTLKTADAGYEIGYCPAAPVINSYEVSELNHDKAVVTGTASDVNDDLVRVSFGVGFMHGGTCTGTTSFTCEIDFESLEIPVADEIGYGLIAEDAQGQTSRFESFRLIRPELGVNPPSITNVQHTVVQSDLTVTADVVDTDGDLATVTLIDNNAVTQATCVNTGGDTFTCNVSGLAEGSYAYKVIAEDAGQNRAESSVVAVEITTSVASCVTAINSEHGNAGRAELRYNVLYYASGSDDYLGQGGDTTSLQETAPGNWVIVSSCP